MARLSIGLDPEDEFRQRIGSTLRPHALVDIGEACIITEDAAQLDLIGEVFLTAARDLRMAQESRSLSSMFNDGDSTAEAMAFVKERRAAADARRRDEEIAAQESVDPATEDAWKAS